MINCTGIIILPIFAYYDRKKILERLPQTLGIMTARKNPVIPLVSECYSNKRSNFY
jgi:hypothetical protein